MNSEDDFVHEEKMSKNFIKFEKPTNSLNYANFQSEEYLTWKLKEKIRLKLRDFPILNKYISEICDLVIINSKKHNIRSNDLISIITYKLIKKNKLHITHTELFDKLNFDKAKYLKYFNDINIGEEEYFDFSKICLDTIVYMINKLNEYYKLNPHAFKHLDNVKMNILFSNTDTDIIEKDVHAVLNEIKTNVRDVIHSQSFYNNFNNTILKEALSAGIIRYYLLKGGIKLSLKTFSNIFHISQSVVSKATTRVEKYMNEYKHN
jgi:hypothetical protein